MPNGVDIEKFSACEPDAGLRAQWRLNGSICVGYVGSLFSWEGVEDFVRAVPRIVASAPQTRFFIVGGGVQAAAIQHLIGELSLADRVLFVGSVPHGDIARYYSILDILVYPRRRTRNTEIVTPLKPLEAMAMEKAVLGSDVGGIRELLAEGTGVFCRPNDPDDLADKCVQLIMHPEDRRVYGRKSRTHVCGA